MGGGSCTGFPGLGNKGTMSLFRDTPGEMLPELVKISDEDEAVI